MRVPWKLVGLAGAAGVAATGVVVARKRRTQTEYDPDELRSRLHERLGEVAPAGEAAEGGAVAGDGGAVAGDGGSVAGDGGSVAGDGGSVAGDGGGMQPEH
jgi:hypothetical protein